jgi:hypothetical protein
MIEAFSDRRHLLVLAPGRAERHYWPDLWAYCEMFAILAWRDVAVRNKQTVIGVRRWPSRSCSGDRLRTRQRERSAAPCQT